MSKQTRRQDTNISRRLFGILGLGAASTGVLAACQADTSGEEESGARNPEGVFHGGYPFPAPPSGHFNMVEGITNAISLGIYSDLIMPGGGIWDWAAEEWLYLMAEGSETTETEFIYDLAPDLTWSDGTDVTPDDVMCSFSLRWLMNQPEWPMVTGFEQTGDLQVTFSVENPSAILERQMVKARIIPTAMYGDFGERARELLESGETTDGDAANELREEVQEWRPENEDIIVSGAFIWDFDRISDATLTLEKNDQGLLADQVEFQTIVLYNGETEDITPLVLDGTIDYATHNFPVSTVREWEAIGLETKTPVVLNGHSITFSMGRRPEFADARFRQALAHCIDREEAQLIVQDEFGQVSEHMTALPSVVQEQWIDEETISRLNPYEFDQSRAAELLEEAGWSLSNGTWMTPEGDPAQYDLTFYSDHTAYPALAQYLAEVLTDFGINIGLDGIESANLDQRRASGQFDMITTNWGSGELHPRDSFRNVFVVYNYPITQNQGGRGIDYDLVREVEGFGEIDIQAIVQDSGAGLDEEFQRERVNELAEIFNRELPFIPFYERLGNTPTQAGPRVLEFPPADDPIWDSSLYADNPMIILMLRGDLQPS